MRYLFAAVLLFGVMLAVGASGVYYVISSNPCSVQGRC